MKLDSAIFYTVDLERSVEFYKDIVGLDLDFHTEGKFAAFRFEGGVKLGIKQKVEEREVPGMQSIIIEYDDLEAKYNEIKDNVEIYKPLHEESFGMNFSFLDLDGNKVVFMNRK
jgi:predicted enzyme related to lactoylglutathione lyase